MISEFLVSGVFRLLPRRPCFFLLLLLNPSLHLLDQRQRARAPALFLLRLLFWLTVHRQRTSGVDRRVRDAADLHVGLVLLEECFTVLHALAARVT